MFNVRHNNNSCYIHCYITCHVTMTVSDFCPKYTANFLMYSLTAYFSHSQNKFTTHGVLANQRTVFTEWRHPLTANICGPDMQSQNFMKVDFPHDALRFMIWQQLVNTDESLGLLTLFSARKLTKWYGFCDLFKSSHGTLFSALFGNFVDSFVGPKCVI